MDKEKIVRDLVNTFNDRDELHIAYKAKLKKILINFALALEEYEEDAPSKEGISLYEFVDVYVETVAIRMNE
jgi:hypothetical protein